MVSINSPTHLAYLLKEPYTSSVFETIRVQVKEEWLECTQVKDFLKLIWKYRERCIYYNPEESTLRLKGIGSCDT